MEPGSRSARRAQEDTGTELEQGQGRAGEPNFATGGQHGWTIAPPRRKGPRLQRPRRRSRDGMMSAVMTPSAWPRVAEMLHAHAPRPPAQVCAEHRLIEDLGFDSLALAKTVVALETEFGTELPPERLHELRTATAGELASLVEEALAA